MTPAFPAWLAAQPAAVRDFCGACGRCKRTRLRYEAQMGGRQVYERFTDRARKVMSLAMAAAQRGGQDAVAPAHIVIGLAKEGGGTADMVFARLGVDRDQIRAAAEASLPTGGDAVVLGRLPHTPEAKNVIEEAINEARNLNHNYVGTEHLLLGLAKVGALPGLGVQTVREVVVGLYSPQAALFGCRPMRADSVTIWSDEWVPGWAVTVAAAG